MSKEIVLHHWAAYKFRDFEYRLLGYVVAEDNKKVSCVVTEPVKGVDALNRRVETYDGKWFKLNTPVEDQGYIMDQMYIIGDWANRNIAPPPTIATDVILEHLEIKEENDTSTKETTPERKAGTSKAPRRSTKTRTRVTKKPRAKRKSKRVAKSPPNPAG